MGTLNALKAQRSSSTTTGAGLGAQRAIQQMAQANGATTSPVQVYNAKGQLQTIGSGSSSPTGAINQGTLNALSNGPQSSSTQASASANQTSDSINVGTLNALKNGPQTYQTYDSKGQTQSLGASSPQVDLPWSGPTSVDNVSGPESRFVMPIPTTAQAKEGLIGGAILLAGTITGGAAWALMGEAATATAAGAAAASGTTMAQEMTIPGATPVEADVANAGFPYPPYDANSPIVDRTVQSSEAFVRVSSSAENPGGSWVMRASDIQGLSTSQIKAAWNIPGEVNFVSEANLPEGTAIRAGVVNGGGPTPFNGAGGAVQYQIMSEPQASWFTNTTPITK